MFGDVVYVDAEGVTDEQVCFDVDLFLLEDVVVDDNGSGH